MVRFLTLAEEKVGWLVWGGGLWWWLEASVDFRKDQVFGCDCLVDSRTGGRFAQERAH